MKKINTVEKYYLYLNKTIGSDMATSLHIGVTSDLEQREKSYRGCHNKGGFISIKRVDNFSDELAFHLYFRAYSRGIDGPEAFIDNPELMDEFKSVSVSEVYQSLFQDREKLFMASDLFRLGTKRGIVLLKSIGTVGISRVLQEIGVAETLLDRSIKGFLTRLCSGIEYLDEETINTFLADSFYARSKKYSTLTEDHELTEYLHLTDCLECTKEVKDFSRKEFK